MDYCEKIQRKGLFTTEISGNRTGPVNCDNINIYRYDWSTVCSHEMWKNKITEQLKEDGFDESKSTLDNSALSAKDADSSNNVSIEDNSENISKSISFDESSTSHQGNHLSYIKNITQLVMFLTT